MKTVYVCDKCGKVFDSYDECSKHEEMHWNVNWGYTELKETLESMNEYKDGTEEPVFVHVELSRWNYEKAETEKRCAKYKLVSSYEVPTVIDAE